MRRAAGFVLVAATTGRILFLLRRDGTWGIPGGLAESYDRSPVATATRELREETGYEGPLALERTPLVERAWPGQLLYVTLGAVVPQEFRCIFGDREHTASRWAFGSTPPEPLHRGVREALASLNERAASALDVLE